VIIRAEQGDDIEKEVFGAAKWLANPCDEAIITRTIGRTQFDNRDIKSNGKSWLKNKSK
jgi:hypothetical protein